MKAIPPCHNWWLAACSLRKTLVSFPPCCCKVKSLGIDGFEPWGLVGLWYRHWKHSNYKLDQTQVCWSGPPTLVDSKAWVCTMFSSHILWEALWSGPFWSCCWGQGTRGDLVGRDLLSFFCAEDKEHIRPQCFQMTHVNSTFPIVMPKFGTTTSCFFSHFPFWNCEEKVLRLRQCVVCALCFWRLLLGVPLKRPSCVWRRENGVFVWVNVYFPFYR